MVLRNLIFDAEVVEQRLRTVVLPHHKQPASEIGDCLQHHSLSSAYNLALVALASTNSVTFSTATLDFTHWDKIDGSNLRRVPVQHSQLSTHGLGTSSAASAVRYSRRTRRI